jgi:hypothetical protein
MSPKSNKSNNQTLMRRPRVPRNRLRATTGGLTTTFRSRYLNQTVANGASVQVAGIVVVQPSQSVGRGSDPGVAIAANHQEYLVNSSTFIYTPAVGTTTPGTLFVAWVDNPEIIGRVYGADGLTPYTNAQLLGLAQTTNKCWSTPIWQQLTCSNAGIPPRRKMFSTDTTTQATVAGIDRSVQGMWIYAVQSAPLSTTLGYIHEEYSASLKGPQNNAISLT